MALFGNQNKKTIEELENYYSGKQQRSGMAWVMAMLSLVLTVVVLGGLFFGGRWLYRTVTDDDTAELATTSETSNSSASTASESSNDTATLGENNSTETSNDTSTGDDTSNAGVVTDEAASTDVPSTTTTDGDETTTSSDNDAADTNDDTDDAADSDSTTSTNSTEDTDTLGVETTTELPNTGSGNMLIIAPVLALVIGYYISLRKQLDS